MSWPKCGDMSVEYETDAILLMLLFISFVTSIKLLNLLCLPISIWKVPYIPSRSKLLSSIPPFLHPTHTY